MDMKSTKQRDACEDRNSEKAVVPFSSVKGIPNPPLLNTPFMTTLELY
jgi:hypothetical protein